jgi:hypothetical protein
MKFNDKQTEGLSRVLDNLETARNIGATVAITWHSDLTNIEVGLLLTAALNSEFVALFLRIK